MPTRPQNEGDACGAGHTVQLCFILEGHSSRKQRVAVREHSQALLHRTLIARKGSRGRWTWGAPDSRGAGETGFPLPGFNLGSGAFVEARAGGGRAGAPRGHFFVPQWITRATRPGAHYRALLGPHQPCPLSAQQKETHHFHATMQTRSLPYSQYA